MFSKEFPFQWQKVNVPISQRLKWIVLYCLCVASVQEIAEPLLDLKLGMEQLARNQTFKHILATLLAMGNFLNGSQVRNAERWGEIARGRESPEWRSSGRQPVSVPGNNPQSNGWRESSFFLLHLLTGQSTSGMGARVSRSHSVWFMGRPKPA